VLGVGYDDGSKDLFINDPLKGETYYLKATKYNISSLRLLTPHSMPTPPTGGDDALAECLKLHKDLMSQLSLKQKEVESLRGKLQACESVRKALGPQVEEFLQENKDLRKSEEELQSKLETANKKIKKLVKENEKLADERNENKNYYEKVLKFDIRKYEPARALVAGLLRALGREPVSRKEK
jgi:septal ring factor EnvC (AmiA/AmiB activator)